MRVYPITLTMNYFVYIYIYICDISVSIDEYCILLGGHVYVVFVWACVRSVCVYVASVCVGVCT